MECPCRLTRDQYHAFAGLSREVDHLHRHRGGRLHRCDAAALDCNQGIAVKREHQRGHCTGGHQLALTRNEGFQCQRRNLTPGRPLYQRRVGSCPLQQGRGDHRLRQWNGSKVASRFLGDERGVEQARLFGSLGAHSNEPQRDKHIPQRPIESAAALGRADPCRGRLFGEQPRDRVAQEHLTLRQVELHEACSNR